MNAERLNRILQIVDEELENTELIDLIVQLRNGLEGQVNQPQETSYQTNVVDTLKTLRTILPKAKSNNFSPAWQQILKEIGIYNYLGNQLLTKINRIIQSNNITLALAVEEISKIYDILNNINNAVDNILSGFRYIRIGAELLQPGECEVGILIPRDAIENKLENLKKEINELEFILKHFDEVASSESSTLQIKTLSSSDLNLLVEYGSQAGAFLAVAVAYLLNSYKTLLEIKKLRSELSVKEVPENTLEPLDEYINNEMEKRIKQFIDDKYEEYCVVKNAGRKNELRNSLEIALNKIANRIDRGFNIEIRMEPIKIDKDSEEDMDESNEALNQQAQTIIESQKDMEFIKTDGEPILSLPEKAPPKKKTKEE